MIARSFFLEYVAMTKLQLSRSSYSGVEFQVGYKTNKSGIIHKAADKDALITILNQILW